MALFRPSDPPVQAAAHRRGALDFVWSQRWPLGVAAVLVVFSQVLPITAYPWSWPKTGWVALGCSVAVWALFWMLERPPVWSPAQADRPMSQPAPTRPGAVGWGVASGVSSLALGVIWLAHVDDGGRTRWGSLIFGIAVTALGVSRLVELRARRVKRQPDPTASG